MNETISAKNPEPISDISDEDCASVPPSNASNHSKSAAPVGTKSLNAEEKGEDLSFPERLMSILQSGTVDHAMKWVANGEALAIMTKVFEKVVLDDHFHGSKYSSFTRKLNRWGFMRCSVGTSMPQGWVAFRHGLFLQSHPELASKMCTGKNRHFVLKEAKAQAKTNSQCQGAAAPRHAAAAATTKTVMHKRDGSFAKTGIMHGHMPVKSPQDHSDAVGLVSLSDNQLQTIQLIKMKLDEAINIERMKLQQRFSDAEAGRVRLQGPAPSLLQQDILRPMDTTSRLMALHQQAQTWRASALSSAAVAPRLHGYESLLREQQAAQMRTSCLSSFPQLHEQDNHLGSQGRFLEEYRFLALQGQLSTRETQLRQQLQEKEALLLNKQSRQGGGGSSSSSVPEEVNVKAGRPVITEAERQRLLRLREQLDYVIGM